MSFPIFPRGEKWEKTHFSHGQKWGWTPQKLEFSHAQDGRLKTPFFIADNADSWVTVSRDLVEYSGSGILFGAYVITATDRKTLRNLIRTTEFSTNWVIKTQLAQL